MDEVRRDTCVCLVPALLQQDAQGHVQVALEIHKEGNSAASGQPVPGLAPVPARVGGAGLAQCGDGAAFA